ncbi:MarR family transcriptional regulator [Thermobifida halotolerans]|uniref:MarR family transcriptional regulator n=1 Tax=Thermobifida halotolerans TaxID=483545 RepID=A0AA97LYK9_9ACTN|nr:MarR family transcriptional regulator [Thermobifida halotolerans]UOE20391.1 MarR family transcriptional regulator [Thermobifida halotolerans]
MDPTPAHQLHRSLMDLVRVAGLLQGDQQVLSHPVSLSQAFALDELGTAGGPLSQRELAERLGLEKSTVSRMVADLERKGLLHRERDPANRRVHRLRITERGRQLRAHLAELFQQRYDRWSAAMAPDEREALLYGLSGLVRAIRRNPPPPG